MADLRASWRLASTFLDPWLDQDNANAALDPSMHTAVAEANLASPEVPPPTSKLEVVDEAGQ